MDWDLDDLKELERTTLAEFTDEGQRAVLLELWRRADKEEDTFEREFGPEEGDDG